MQITNLQVAEHNGVVTAQFEWGGCKVTKFEMDVYKLVNHCVRAETRDADCLFSSEDLHVIVERCKDYVKHNLSAVFYDYFTTNLQEAA